ncbi:uncharacterized protein LOC116430830 isoform X2 [Nomia melanderi]|uniref:uncharacterized protein LOC116430830 isoform X2 n=1 Tax=Nomia melanderi TaxID=2448451 RepID=UPI00130462C1|nr:uncharacterized protein LOC116430830 isoform X2 [Nomia melanderi]
MVLVPIKSKHDVPADYEYISPSTAKEEQWNLISKWEPRSEVQAILHGDKCIAGICAVSNIIVNTMFRRKLKLHRNGFVVSNVFAVIGGGVFGSHFFKKLVTDELLTYKPNCFTCMELKAMLYTNLVAVGFPAITFSSLCLGIAGYLGLRVPYWTEGRELYRFWWSVIRPGLPHLSILLILNSVTVSIVAWKQATEVQNIGNIILEVDKYLKQKKLNELIE